MSDSGPSPRPQGDADNAHRDSKAPKTEQELAQAFKDLARGEQTATALEANLTSLETKLDELLASFGSSADAVSPPIANGNKKGVSDGKAKADK